MISLSTLKPCDIGRAVQELSFNHVRGIRSQIRTHTAALPKLCSAYETRPKNAALRRIARAVYL